jgi:hypothetical protein
MCSAHGPRAIAPRGLQAAGDRREASHSRRRAADHRSWRRTGRLVADRRQGDDSTNDNIRVAAIDFLEMDAIPGVHFMQMDFLEDDAPKKLIEAVGGTPDLVISDMAAPTTGHQRTDHLRTMHLCEVAAHFAD